MPTVAAVCSSCKGTGLYSGFGEADNVAVVCQTCKGTGCFDITYEPFEKRKAKRGIKKVFEKNCGWGLGKESVGGLSYAEWSNGKSFFGHEQRDKVCPRQHSYEFSIKDCKDLSIGTRFTDCPHFKNKSNCWFFYDQANGKGIK